MADKRKKSHTKQVLYTMAVVCCFLLFLFYQLRLIKHQHQIRQTLRQVHIGLQNYHVEYEVYVPGPELKMSELIFHLHETGFMDEIPVNPYTGKVFIENDPDDSMRYRTDEILETFKLEAVENGTVVERMESNGLGKMEDESPY